ncbi:MAG: hypothetical protein ACI94Y_001523 [Maribacter sp.]|jgi:hypothetical protein
MNLGAIPLYSYVLEIATSHSEIIICDPLRQIWYISEKKSFKLSLSTLPEVSIATYNLLLRLILIPGIVSYLFETLLIEFLT